MLNANVGVSDKGPAQNAQIAKNGPKWVQNGRQVLRIGPRESYGCSGAFGTGLPHSMFFLRPACLAGQPAAKQPRLDDNVECQHRMSMLNVNVECQC